MVDEGSTRMGGEMKINLSRNTHARAVERGSPDVERRNEEPQMRSGPRAVDSRLREPRGVHMPSQSITIRWRRELQQGVITGGCCGAGRGDADSGFNLCVPLLQLSTTTTSPDVRTRMHRATAGSLPSSFSKHTTGLNANATGGFLADTWPSRATITPRLKQIQPLAPRTATRREDAPLNLVRDWRPFYPAPSLSIAPSIFLHVHPVPHVCVTEFLEIAS